MNWVSHYEISVHTSKTPKIELLKNQAIECLSGKEHVSYCTDTSTYISIAAVCAVAMK